MSRRTYLNFNQILTHAAVQKKDGVGITEDDLGIIENGALVVDENQSIEYVGPTSKLPGKYLKNSKRHEMEGHFLTPGLVDCHTHLVFAGNRFNELYLRLEGKTYQEIAALGGGIKKTVLATRKADFKTLFNLGSERIERALNYGVRVLEIKSGYGLDWPTEKKVLQVIRDLKKKYAKKLFICSTFLGAHDFPPESRSEKDKEKYVSEIINVMLPALAKEKLADFCDVFFDQGYYTREQSFKILSCARKQGLKIKLHADELSPLGGAGLAAELKAVSADHLLQASLEDLKAMARQNVTAVLLPGTAFYLGLPYVDIKKLREAKVTMALATDFNPGSSPTQNLPFVMSLACLQMKMTMAEAIAAATFGGAKALGLQHLHGFLKVGNKSSFSIFQGQSYHELIGRVADTLAL